MSALKVLSSEMDLAQSMFIRKILKRKERSFQKNPPVPHPVKALESYSATSYSCWLFGTNCQRRTQLCHRLFIFHTQILPTALWTNFESVSNGAINMLAQNVVFSVGNDAINAPQKCQPRNEWEHIFKWRLSLRLDEFSSPHWRFVSK